MIEQLRMNCVNQMQWMLSHRFSYGYWEIPSQDRSNDTEQMKQDEEFIKKWYHKDNKFNSMWDYQIKKYAESISRLWENNILIIYIRPE